MAVQTLRRVMLAADTARDLMNDTPVSINANANLREAIVLLTDKGYSAAPVIDDAGRPVGVISHTDIIVHDRERVEHVGPAAAPEFYDRAELRDKAGGAKGFQVEKVDKTRVRDMMTPAVFSVKPEAPAAQVIAEMLALHVHRLFVVDDAGVLVGIISALDIIKHLRADY